MVFASLIFVFTFLCLNLIFYYQAKTIQGKNRVLLVFSLIFYTWAGVKYVFLLLGMSLCSWFFALMIEACPERSQKKVWLTAECVVLLGLLGIFKYTGFFLGNLKALTGFPSVIPEIALPVGISFYTFQLISYVVDVFRGEVKAQRAYWKVLLYCSLFHQCIAGPIVRYQSVAEEIDHRTVSADDLSDGIRRFSIGLAKKAVLANACASAADTFLENTASSSTAGLWFGMIFYMLDIYLDFSAYSDMAIGMGRMVGFHYLENFNYPYMAKSVKDFWRRWHISLSSFFRDYVYIPLGGSRCSTLCLIRNMFIVWFLTGFWHGASWNYIFWGLYFFVFLVAERFFLQKLFDRIPAVFGHLYLLLVVLIGWVFFKFEDTSELLTVLSGMFGAGGRSAWGMTAGYTLLNNLYLLIFSAIACTPLGSRLRQLVYRIADRRKRPAVLMYWLDAFLPAVLLILSLMALVGNSYNPFLYFQF